MRGIHEQLAENVPVAFLACVRCPAYVSVSPRFEKIAISQKIRNKLSSASVSKVEKTNFLQKKLRIRGRAVLSFIENDR